MKNPIKSALHVLSQPFTAVAEDLSELSRGATRLGEQAIEQVQDAIEARKPPAKTPSKKAPGRNAPAKKTAPKAIIKENPSRKPSEAPVSQAPAELPDKTFLLAQARDAIHRTYHMEGGFRFFAGNFCRHVRLILPRQTDVEEMFVDAFSSCLRPMCRHLQKLEKTLAELKTQWGGEPMVPENQALLDAMTGFAARAEAERLNTPEGWAPEDYRAALIRYSESLQQLLDAWPEPEE